MPKAVKDALKEFATEEQLKELTMLVEMTLKPIWKQEDLNPDAGGGEQNKDDAHEDDDESGTAAITEELQTWHEGTEEYAKWSREQVKEALGLGTMDTLPMFNDTCDWTGAKRSPWDKTEWAKVIADQAEVALRPHWHQLVGILKILVTHSKENAIMVMDQVGIGKTMQAIGVIAMRWVLLKAQKEKKTLGGQMGKSPLLFEWVHVLTNHCR